MNNLGADRSTCRKAACVCISLSSCKTDVKCDSKAVSGKLMNVCIYLWHHKFVGAVVVL